LTVGSEKLAVGSGQGPRLGIIGGKFSDCKYLIFPKKRDNVFSRCHNIPDRKGKNQRGASLILDITINKRVIIKETVNEGLTVLISKGYK